jgi:hypothetical protein
MLWGNTKLRKENIRQATTPLYVLYISVASILTVAAWDWVAPPPVSLADCPVGGTREYHPLLAPAAQSTPVRLTTKTA